MIWPFRKKPQPPRVIDRRENGLCWEPGDLAECVDDDWEDGSDGDPSVGDILRVRKIEDDVNHRNIRCIWLWFEGRDVAYNTQAFRKIVLTHDDAEVEEGIISKIKRAAKQGAETFAALTPDSASVREFA